MFVNPHGSMGGYQITNSVRLRAGASAYFSRTFVGGTDPKKFTFAFNLKRSLLGSAQHIGPNYYTGDAANCFLVYFDANDKLTLSGDAGGVWPFGLTTIAQFRDPSAHLHITVQMDSANATAASRCIISINGVVQSTTGTVVPSNATFRMNDARACVIGQSGNASYYTDGYISNFYFVDGQSLSAASFGQTDSNGVWVPKAYAGTYGNNGFHLDFKDANLTAGSNVGLGKDVSGNGNYWNTNNISVTAGVTYDSMVDTPTNNYCTPNGLDQYGNLIVLNGGLALYNTASAAGTLGWRGTFGVSSGKWYWEITQTATQNSRAICTIGIDTPNTAFSAGGGAGSGAIATSWVYQQSSGNKNNNSSSSAYGASWSTGDVIGVAYDADNGKLYFRKNGTWQNSGDPVGGTGFAYSGLSGTLVPSGTLYHDAFDGSAVQIDANFGQRPFSASAPTGFKALCTANLPSVAIANPSTGIKHRWEAGSGIAANIASDRSGWTNWIEIFKRTDTTEDWKFRFSSDTGNMMACNTNAAKVAWSAPSAGTYLGIAIQAEAAYGCVTGTYTGDNTANRNISHSLGKAPTCGIVKNEASGDWFFWHTKMTSAAYFTIIDSATPPAQSNTNSPWGTGSWLSSTFMVTNNATNNANANAAVYRYILFSDITGLLAMLGFTGNGSTDGAFEWAGQRPQIQIEKDLVATTGFYLFSDLIDAYNPTASYLLLNTTAATAAATGVDIVSNGIKHRSATIANAADAYSAISYARNPFGGSNVSPSPAR